MQLKQIPHKNTRIRRYLFYTRPKRTITELKNTDIIYIKLMIGFV